MVKEGYIFVYTTPISEHKKYYIEEIYESDGELMVTFSWELDVDIWSRTTFSLEKLMSIYQTGHIKFINSDERKPLRIIRRHTFNPKLRNLQFSIKMIKCPYRTPKLFEWS